MARGRLYTENDNKFILANLDMDADKVAAKMGRSEDSIKAKISKLTGSHPIREIHNAGSTILLHKKGEENKLQLASLKELIQNSKSIKLIIKEDIENVKVLSFTDRHFTVQRANYRESFQYTELLNRDIRIIS